MTEAVVETKMLTEEERNLRALAVLSYAGTRLARAERKNATDERRQADDAGTVTQGGESVMPEQTRKRIRKAIRRGQLARRVVEIALVVLLLLAAAYAAIWAWTRPYDLYVVAGYYEQPEQIENPLDKAIVIGTVKWLEKNRPTEPYPSEKAGVHKLMGGHVFNLYERGGMTTHLYSVQLNGRSRIQVTRNWRNRTNWELIDYNDVPLPVMKALDRLSRRVVPGYAEDVPADYYDDNRVRKDSTEGSGAFPNSPYSVFKPEEPVK